MVRSTTEADARIEYVNDQIDRAIDREGVDAETYDVTPIGSGDDRYLSTSIVFDPYTTARDVARVRRSLPMSFDKEIDFRGGETLVLRVRVGASE